MKTEDSRSTPKRKKFRLADLADVQRCLAGVIRNLRVLKISDKEIDTVEINRARTMIYGLKTMSELLATSGLQQVSDEALIAEVQRRRDGRLELGVRDTPVVASETH